MPALEQAIQWHGLRTTDPGIAWLRDLMRAAGAALDQPFAGRSPGSP